MPYSAKDAKAKTKKADTPKKQRMFAHIANAALSHGDDEATAIRKASGTVKKAAKARKK